MFAEHFTSPVFNAALELWVAARTDETLHAAVVPLEQRVGREAHQIAVEALGVDESRPGVRELVQATLDLVRGLGLANTISDDTARRRRILGAWARTLDEARRMSLLDDVLDDLAAEGGALEAMVAPSRRGRLAHADTGRRAGTSPRRSCTSPGPTRSPRGRGPTDKEAWDAVVLEAIADPEGYVDAQALAGAQAAPAEHPGPLAGRPPGAAARRCAATPPGEKMPWFGPPMSPTSMATARFMETWAHALDVDDALGIAHRADRPDPARRPPRRTHPRTSRSACTGWSRRPRSSASS